MSSLDVSREAVAAARWRDTGGPRTASLYAGHHHLAPFADHSVHDLHLELHTAATFVGAPLGIGDDRYWGEARPARAPSLAGALVPSDELLLWHTCVHFAWSHRAATGAWRTIRSIGIIVERGSLDWERFVEIVDSSQAGPFCFWSLYLSRQLAGIPIPQEVLVKLGQPWSALERRSLERFLIGVALPNEGAPCPSTWLSDYLWRLAMRIERLAGADDDVRRARSGWLSLRQTDPALGLSGRLSRQVRALAAWRRFVWEMLSPR